MATRRVGKKSRSATTTLFPNSVSFGQLESRTGDVKCPTVVLDPFSARVTQSI